MVMTNDKQRVDFPGSGENVCGEQTKGALPGRGRLVELLSEDIDMNLAYYVADNLLANGVIVPPCKVGQTVYSIDNCINRPEMIVVTSIHHHRKHTFFSALSRSQREYCFEEKDIGKTVFLSREEAEAKLKEGVQV